MNVANIDPSFSSSNVLYTSVQIDVTCVNEASRPCGNDNDETGVTHHCPGSLGSRLNIDVLFERMHFDIIHLYIMDPFQRPGRNVKVD